MSALNLAFDMSPFKDTVPTLYALHAYQTLLALLHNRTQDGKVSILKFAGTIGYHPVHTPEEMEQLISDVCIFSIFGNIVTDMLPFSANEGLLRQAIDGLTRSARHLPDHARSDYLKSIDRFRLRIMQNQPVRPMALLINTAPMLQEQPNFESASATTAQAMLSDFQPPPDFRRITDSVRQTSDNPTETALVAQLRPRPLSNPSDRTRPVANGTRYETRPDYNQRDSRRDARPNYERRDPRHDTGRPRQVELPSPALTMDEMQKAMSDLQSQFDRVRQPRKDDTAKTSRLPLGSAHMAAARSSSMQDTKEEAERAFFALGAASHDTVDLPCHMDSDDYSD